MNAVAKNTLQQKQKLKTTILVHALHQHQYDRCNSTGAYYMTLQIKIG
jgi:hypothetical protein